MSLSSIGRSLRVFREECGYTQQHLTDMLNTGCSAYSYYESGRATPDISSLIMLSQVLSVNLPELLGQENISPILNDSFSGKSGSKHVTGNNSHIYNLKKDELQLIAFFWTCTVREKEEFLRKAAEIQSKNKEKELDWAFAEVPIS